MSDVLVSVDCITYNHAAYIRDALEGILSQNTDFAFEILVHDDCSTDGTQDIIREYEEKYPDIVKPIYQTENQYTRDFKFYARYQFPRAQGKYFASCEGDDYWTDPDKLRAQVDYMETHPDCSFCIHGAEFVRPDGDLLRYTHFADCDRDFDLTYFMRNREEFMTATLMIPTRLLTDLPTWYYRALTGDTPIALYALSQGYGHYINRIMSCYRVAAPGSWSANTAKLPHVNFAAYKANLAQLYAAADDFTGYKHHDEMVKHVNEQLRRTVKRAALGFENLSPVRRIQLALMICFPGIYKKIKGDNIID